jgi:hypothetical protein
MAPLYYSIQVQQALDKHHPMLGYNAGITAMEDDITHTTLKRLKKTLYTRSILLILTVHILRYSLIIVIKHILIMILTYTLTDYGCRL